jgi:hypothetical protein
MKPALKKSILIVILAVVSAVDVVSTNAVEALFLPFKGVDLTGIYDSYSQIIDFAIFIILFVGLSQATLGKRFDSRGGRAVVSAVGLTLAIGLTVSARNLGFNLRSFGPLAAGIFIFFVGFMLYLGIKTAGMSKVNAGAVALVITYFSIVAVAPTFFEPMARNPYLSWFHSVVLIAVIILAFNIIKLPIIGRKNRLNYKTGKLRDSSSDQQKVLSDQIHVRKRESKFIKKRLEKISEQAHKSSKEIIADLLELKKLVEEFGNKKQGRHLIARKLAALSPKEQRVTIALQTLKQRVKKLSSFDHQHFEQLKDDFHNKSAIARRQIEEECKAEWLKIGAENKILRLEKAGEIHNQNFIHAIHAVVASLKANRVGDALAWIDKAITSEERIDKIFRKMEHLEKKLELYTKREIRAEKKEIKEFKKAQT